MGAYAVKLLKEGKKNRVVSMQKGIITDFDINEALSMKKSIDEEMVELNKILAL